MCTRVYKSCDWPWELTNLHSINAWASLCSLHLQTQNFPNYSSASYLLALNHMGWS